MPTRRDSSCKVSTEKTNQLQSLEDNIAIYVVMPYQDFETGIAFEQGGKMTFAMTLDL